MAFTYDVTTNRGKVRLQLGDTTAAAYVFEDAEIDYFLDAGTTVNGATVEGLRVLMADAALRSKLYTLKGMTFDDRKRVEDLERLVKMYGGDMPTASVTYTATLPMDSGFIEPAVTS